MSDNSIWSQPIETLAPKIQKGTLSPVQLIECLLDRIEKYDGLIKSFVTIGSDIRAQAIDAEKEIKEGRYKGPLHGVPIAVKDNYLTSDMQTKAGTSSEVNFPSEDSFCVAKLREAGAIIIGKTNMKEFAWGGDTPPTRNPWKLDCVPGGSSGGSGAAIAAGFVPAALGSDTGGSIRMPAGLCGTVGLKPTYGLIGRSGIVPHSWSLDHAGPLAATVADTVFVTEALQGYDENDPGNVNIKPQKFSEALGAEVKNLKIGICRNHFFEGLERDVEKNVEAAIDDISKLGCEIIEFEVPNLEFGLGAIFAIELASSSAWHDHRIKKGLTSGYQKDVQTLVEIGQFITAIDYLKAEQFRRVLINDFTKIFNDINIIVSPTLPLTAWRVGENMVQIGESRESALAASWRLTYPWNLTGFPALSVPCGYDKKGLPVGLQLAAAPFKEADLFRLAYAYEEKAGWKALRATLKS